MRDKKFAGAAWGRFSSGGEQNALRALGGKRCIFLKLIALKRED
jgi:hypothetical protein